MKRSKGVRFGLLALIVGAVMSLAGPADAATTFQVGDVFVATSNSTVQWRNADGTLHSVIATLPSAFTTGMAFEDFGDQELYVTGFDGNSVTKVNNMGVMEGAFGSGYNANPESILFDASGNAYVGQAGGTGDILKFDLAGNFLASYNVATEDRGSDWIDLAADQCTMYYTSEGQSVKRYDVCTSTQLSDFATGLPGSAAYALRLLLPSQGGGLLVADTQAIHRLDGSGNIAQSYDVPGQDCWFALNLDPDATSFWSADFCTSNVYKFDISTGAVLQSFNTGTPTFTVFGLTIKGEITAARTFVLTLEPQQDENPLGSSHTVTATLTDSTGTPEPGATILFSVSGANTAAGAGVTDANGQATFTYSGTHTGTDTITACYDANTNGTCDEGELTATATKRWVIGPPATLTLSPHADANPVDSQHCVTAHVEDAFGNPTPNITVRFSVTGSVITGGARVTNANGDAVFCYTGPALPGSDVITAFADTNNNGVQDPGEPSDRATKEWVLPASTPGCKVTDGGRITAANGDKATFGSVAMGLTATTASGAQEYQDHGAAADLNVHSTAVLAVACSGNRASVFGTATINGSGSYNYRIDLTDNAEPGAGADRYRIRLATGYDSGEQTLLGGNIQMH